MPLSACSCTVHIIVESHSKNMRSYVGNAHVCVHSSLPSVYVLTLNKQLPRLLKQCIRYCFQIFNLKLIKQNHKFFYYPAKQWTPFNHAISFNCFEMMEYGRQYMRNSTSMLLYFIRWCQHFLVAKNRFGASSKLIGWPETDEPKSSLLSKC